MEKIVGLQLQSVLDEMKYLDPINPSFITVSNRQKLKLTKWTKIRINITQIIMNTAGFTNNKTKFGHLQSS